MEQSMNHIHKIERVTTQLHQLYIPIYSDGEGDPTAAERMREHAESVAYRINTVGKDYTPRNEGHEEAVDLWGQLVEANSNIRRLLREFDSQAVNTWGSVEDAPPRWYSAFVDLTDLGQDVQGALDECAPYYRKFLEYQLSSLDI